MARFNTLSVLAACLLSLSSQASTVTTCSVANINAEGRPQTASAVIDQNSAGRLSAIVKVDGSAESLGVEAVDANDPVAQIYIRSFQGSFSDNSRYARFDGYGFLGNAMPSSKYMGVLLTAYDASGASLGSMLYLGMGAGNCE